MCQSLIGKKAREQISLKMGEKTSIFFKRIFREPSIFFEKSKWRGCWEKGLTDINDGKREAEKMVSE